MSSNQMIPARGPEVISALAYADHFRENQPLVGNAKLVVVLADEIRRMDSYWPSGLTWKDRPVSVEECLEAAERLRKAYGHEDVFPRNLGPENREILRRADAIIQAVTSRTSFNPESPAQ